MIRRPASPTGLRSKLAAVSPSAIFLLSWTLLVFLLAQNTRPLFSMFDPNSGQASDTCDGSVEVQRVRAAVANHFESEGLSSNTVDSATEGSSEQQHDDTAIIEIVGKGASSQQLTGGDDDGLPNVLVLTPIKNGMRHLDGYFQKLRTINYPRSKISIGLLDGDSDDQASEELMSRVREAAKRNRQVARFLELAGSSGSGSVRGRGESDHHTHARVSGTMAAMLAEVPALAEEYRRVVIVQHDFGHKLRTAERHGMEAQLARRVVMARSRNHLLLSALRESDQWAFWIDSDLHSYQPSILKDLLSANKLHTSEVKQGRPQALHLEGYSSTGHLYLHHLRKQEPGQSVVRLDAVGGAMLLVDAELHRHGLMFPAFVHRHRVETEGLSMMALDMGVMVSQLGDRCYLAIKEGHGLGRPECTHDPFLAVALFPPFCWFCSPGACQTWRSSTGSARLQAKERVTGLYMLTKPWLVYYSYRVRTSISDAHFPPDVQCNTINFCLFVCLLAG